MELPLTSVGGARGRGFKPIGCVQLFNKKEEKEKKNCLAGYDFS